MRGNLAFENENLPIGEGFAQMIPGPPVAEPQLENMLLNMPQPAHPDTPVGSDETENVEVRKWGQVVQSMLSVITDEGENGC